VGRTWKLWAHRYESGELWHIGDRDWVKLYQLQEPIVHVLVEEILGDPYDPGVTHYGWQDAEDSQSRHEDPPTMIQIRTGADPSDPKRALMFLNMCFPYGLDAAIERGDGHVVALRITEHPEAAQ
jgi:hypothetical protein